MRYYIRRDKNARVDGPFTVETLVERLRDGRIPPDALASSDLGEAVAAIEVWRDCDWFPLAKIEDLRAAVPEPPSTSAAKPQSSMLINALCMLSTAVLVYENSERGWFMWLWLGLCLVGLTLEFVRYVWRRAKRAPAV
jgi:hypothetical protein